jgi:hypothetical protein
VLHSVRYRINKCNNNIIILYCILFCFISFYFIVIYGRMCNLATVYPTTLAGSLYSSLVPFPSVHDPTCVTVQHLCLYGSS